MADSRQVIYDCTTKFDVSIDLKSKQVESLEHVLSGTDVIVNLPVGYGKSLIYQLLPGIFKANGQANDVVIVISPLNIIQEEQIEYLKEHNVSVCKLPYGDRSTKVDIDGILEGRYSVIFAHPEALLNSENGQKLLGESSFVDRVGAIAVDECHIVEEW